MNKLKLIIRREFIAKVRNKSFIMMTFLSPIILVGMGFLIYFLTQKNDEKIKEIVYVDNSGMFSKEDFRDTKNIKYIDYSALGIALTKKKVEEGNYYGETRSGIVVQCLHRCINRWHSKLLPSVKQQFHRSW